MARIRTIKPEFFLNDEIGSLPPLTRLLLIGIWTQADRDGRLEDRPKRLKAAILPYDDVDVDEAIESLCITNNLIRYEVDGKGYLQVVNFTKHQSPHLRECSSTIPAPCLHGADTVEAPAEPLGTTYIHTKKDLAGFSTGKPMPCGVCGGRGVSLTGEGEPCPECAGTGKR